MVDYCIKNDLYVIINQHWDGDGLEHDGLTAATDVDATKGKTHQDPDQIANSFKDYDERLIFAGMNEPGVGGGDDNALLGTADLANRIAEYEQTSGSSLKLVATMPSEFWWFRVPIPISINS